MVASGAMLLSTLLTSGQSQTKTTLPFRIDFDPSQDLTTHNQEGQLLITVRFKIHVSGDSTEDLSGSYKVVIEEDGRRVREADVPRPKPVDDLTAMLVMDTSGSMKEHGRMPQARAAADLFLSKLSAQATCGLILFDHEIRPPVMGPVLDRQQLRQPIHQVGPRGGTAYLDATAAAIAMLAKSRRSSNRAVVLMTDGLDLNSSTTLPKVLQQAAEAHVRIYTVGIGEAGKLEPVTSVLVLDHSGSMQPPADEQDKTSKIKALHQAGARYVDMMSGRGRATLLPFSTTVGNPEAFTSEKAKLIANIKQLEPAGETAFLDATFAALATLEAEQATGKRVVVAMTDGVDNSSRHRVDEVIARAREIKVPLYLLGFGRPGELDPKVMEEMAQQTGGKYYHAKNEKALLDIFENLSIHIHDDGIDEQSLRQLAQGSGGQYYHAKNVSELKIILEGVAKTMQVAPYEITFPSLRQVSDATARKVSLKLVRRSGEVVSNSASGQTSGNPGEIVVEEKQAGYQTHGVVVAEMNHMVYLGLLAVIGGLIALPTLLQRRGQGARA